MGRWIRGQRLDAITHAVNQSFASGHDGGYNHDIGHAAPARLCLLPADGSKHHVWTRLCQVADTCCSAGFICLVLSGQLFFLMKGLAIKSVVSIS